MSFWDGGLLPVPQPEGMGRWAEANVVLTEALAGKGAGPLRLRWWQWEVIDAIDLRLTRRLSLLVYSRAGKSTLALVVKGHTIAVTQTSSMFVLPTRELLADWNEQKVEPFLASCPAANALVKRNRNDGLSTSGITYRGGARKVYYRTGRVVGGLKQLTAEIGWIDEVDDCNLASRDGSYSDLMHQRGADAINPIWVESGTPTELGASAIEVAVLKESDQREQWVPHDACGQRTRFTLEQAAKVHGGPYLQHCESCGTAMEEAERFPALPQGIWIPRRPERSAEHRGYHLNMFYSPDHTVDEIMATWNPEKIRGFYTQVLALTPPEIEIPVPEDEAFRAARGPAPEERLLMRTVGVDCQTQRNPRFEVTVLDFYGDPYDPDRWVRTHFLLLVENDKWLRAARQLRQALRPYRPDVVMVDVGGNRSNNSETLKTALAQAFGGDWTDNRVKAIKGIGDTPSAKWKDTPVIHREVTRETTANHRTTIPIHSSIVKCRLWEEGGVFDRGRLRFTDVDDDLPDDYWEQLTSEELRRTVRRQGNVETEHLRWMKVSRTRPTECLHTLVYAEAGRLYLGLDYRRRSGVRVDEDLLNTMMGSVLLRNHRNEKATPGTHRRPSGGLHPVRLDPAGHHGGLRHCGVGGRSWLLTPNSRACIARRPPSKRPSSRLSTTTPPAAVSARCRCAALSCAN